MRETTKGLDEDVGAEKDGLDLQLQEIQSIVEPVMRTLWKAGILMR